MLKLSPTQMEILKGVAEQPEQDVRNFMQRIKSPAIRDKIIESMLKNGLITEDDEAYAYLISAKGLEAVGKHPVIADSQPDKPALPKAHNKQGTIIGLLSRSEGATLNEMVEATGWQKHSVRGLMAGNLKKKLGLTIVSSKENGGNRVYKILATKVDHDNINA